MYYSGVIKDDVINGIGVGVSLFVSGCDHNCDGCFNPETHNYHYGKLWTDETENKLIDYLKAPQIDHLSILGGEPFSPLNIITVQNLVTHVKELLSDIIIWIWTGDTTDEWTFKVKQYPILFSIIDYIIDGRFILSRQSYGLAFRGSSNQQIWHNEKSDTQEVISKWVDVTEYFDTKGV